VEFFVFLYFRNWHSILIQRLLQASDGPLGLFMIFDDMTLQSVDGSPINPQAIFMTASEIHLNFGTGRVVGSSSWSVRGPNSSVQRINSFTFMMAVVECLGLGIRVSR